MHYLIDASKGFTVHQGTREECERYVRNVRDLFDNRSIFILAQGAKDRDKILRRIKNAS